MLNKRTGIFIFVLLGIMAGILLFASLYLKYREEKPTELTVKTCPAMTTTIVDGILNQIDGDFLYVTPKGNNESKVINLTSETKFLELSISPNNNEGLFNENQINRGGLRQGDQLSVVVLHEKENFANNTAMAVRRMVAQGQ